MSQTFTCPDCGATLEYSGAGHTMKCSYCRSDIAVPEELWHAAETSRQELEQEQAQRKWLKYLLIFLAVTVGLPVCFSLIGTLLGFGGAIIGIISTFFPRIFH